MSFLSVFKQIETKPTWKTLLSNTKSGAQGNEVCEQRNEREDRTMKTYFYRSVSRRFPSPGIQPTTDSVQALILFLTKFSHLFFIHSIQLLLGLHNSLVINSPPNVKCILFRICFLISRYLRPAAS